MKNREPKRLTEASDDEKAKDGQGVTNLFNENKKKNASFYRKGSYVLPLMK